MLIQSVVSAELIIRRILDMDSLREGAIVCDDGDASYRQGSIFVTSPDNKRIILNFDQREIGDNIFSSTLTLFIIGEPSTYVHSFNGRTEIYSYSDQTGKMYTGAEDLLNSRLSELANSQPNREEAIRAVELCNGQIGQPVSPDVISNNNRHFRTLV